jgi:hypothetical protein
VHSLSPNPRLNPAGGQPSYKKNDLAVLADTINRNQVRNYRQAETTLSERGRRNCRPRRIPTLVQAG